MGKNHNKLSLDHATPPVTDINRFHNMKEFYVLCKNLISVKFYIAKSSQSI